MSVAPGLTELPTHRVPERLGHLVEGASGPDGDRVWVAGTHDFADGAFALGLVLRVTSATHGQVEPDEERPFAEYETHLAATATLWTPGER